MHLVGVVEIAAGLVVPSRPRFGGLLVAGWLAGIIVNLLLVGGYGDIALRDFGLLLGALTLSRLASASYAERRPQAAGSSTFPSGFTSPVPYTRVSDVGILLVGSRSRSASSGVVVPVLPGALLVWAAIAVWAFAVGSATSWAVLAVVSVVIGGAQLVKVLVPGRQLRDAGVPRRSIVGGSGARRCRLLRHPRRGVLRRLSARHLRRRTSATRAARPRLGLDAEGAARTSGSRCSSSCPPPYSPPPRG